MKDSDRYGFGSNDDTYMNLYRLNGNDLELLGKRSPAIARYGLHWTLAIQYYYRLTIIVITVAVHTV